MKKRNSFIFACLCCALMVLCAVPAVTASAEDADGKKGARLEYGLYGDKWGSGETEQRETSYQKYFKVFASPGAIVTYKEGKKEIATEYDAKNEDGDEVYYFKLPKRGDKEITVKFEDGSPEVKLKATVDAPQKGTTTTETVSVKQAKYDPKAEGYEYGNITATVDGLPSEYEGDNDFVAYVADSTTDKEMWGNILEIYYHPLKMDTDDVKNRDKEEMNAFLKPLLREGATVILEPSRGEGNYGYKDSYYKISSITSTELKVNLVTDTYKYKMKTAKVKIAKQKNPPKVKVDAVKGTIGISDKMEYRFRKYDENGKLGKADAWTAGTKGMKLSAVSGGSIVSGGVIEVRLAKTSKALYSKSLNITIPSQSVIDTTKIKWDGVTTNGSLTISDWNKDTKPYEYTASAPSDSTKWITVKGGKITFTKKKPASGTIYIREKGINENTVKKLELKLPSTIASATVSGSSIPDEKIVAYSGK